ncbi:hypothetical protein FOL46_007367 [Perkinsus olseni]|uniref:Uncharacterized protein n=1 Tax=Perkinsus olseni TaxID=32597 RepID=A0A7J6LED0_PEROL|nr:hypothetical protein FOL46_007367 [Perkinsus olseni]
MGGVEEDAWTVRFEPLSVTADYPKGCNGKPSVTENRSDIVYLLRGTCLYNLEGYNSHRAYQESTGIMIKTNMPGREGFLYLQFNRLILSVNISGRLNLDAEGEGVYTRWNPGGRDITYEGRFGGISKIEISMGSSHQELTCAYPMETRLATRNTI